MPELLHLFVLPQLLRPLWLLALLPLPLVLWWLRGQRERDDPWTRVIDAPLLLQLRAAQSMRAQTQLQMQMQRLLLLSAIWCCGVLALAGPSFARAPPPARPPGGALVVLLDESLSMYARDVSPDRATRARQEVFDVVQRFSGRVALIAYAGDAHVVTPLTEDSRTLTHLLASLEPSLMPIPGADLGAALALARQLLARGGERSGAILVVTDEIANAADLSAVLDPQFPISVLGVGTAAGGPIPLAFLDRPNRVLTDAQGLAILPRLDSERLRRVAAEGGGVYVEAGATDDDTAALLRTLAPADAGSRALRFSALPKVWQDHGHWFVLLLLPLCAYAFRRGVIVLLLCLPLLPLLPLPRSQAEPLLPPAARDPPLLQQFWDDLWWNADQQGLRALRAGRPDEAANLFNSPLWQATALYRSGKFKQAAGLFRNAPDADGAYNLGNSLARAGAVADALAAYDRALALDPGHADAAFNKALLLRAQRAQSGEQTGASGDEQRRGGAAASTTTSAAERTQAGRRPVTSQARAASAAARASATEAARQRAAATARERAQAAAARAQARSADDERADATEQWLRRVRDDPGQMLRSKFEAESAQREARGELAPESDRPW